MADPETMPDVVDALQSLLDRQDLTFAECSLAEEWADAASVALAEITRLRAERDALRARVETLEGALVEEREEVLWQAYGNGSKRDGKWSHNFMSDGEWLVRECGMDPALGWYDAATIQAAIPAAARAALKEKNDGQG